VTAPNIYEFTDFRSWLSQWHAVCQQSDPTFTRTEVSHRLGLPRTRGYFSDVLGGKRVSDTFLERFCELLDLTRAEERYFRTLVRFDQADTPEEKELALEQLAALNRAPNLELEPSSWAYYRDWHHGALRALIEAEDLTEETLPKAAARFNPPFTPGQASQSLQILLDLGLAKRTDDGHLKPTDQTIASPTWAKDEIFRLLQAQQLELVRQALTVPGDGSRAIATNLVAVSEAGCDRIRQLVERFRQELRAIVHRDPDPADRVILLANILLPLHEARK
jgi:uncharacterized protein (TIGR02147 family)